MICDLCQSAAAVGHYEGQAICAGCLNGLTGSYSPAPDNDGSPESRELTGPEYLRWYLEERIVAIKCKLDAANAINPHTLHASALENDLDVVTRLYLDVLDDLGLWDTTDATNGDPQTELGANLLYHRYLKSQMLLS